MLILDKMLSLIGEDKFRQKAKDDGGLLPSQDNNAFCRNLDRRELNGFIKNSY